MPKAPGAPPLELFLFYNGPNTLRIATDGAIDGLVVDCESAGKHLRQQGFDTEVNTWRPADVAAARAGFPNGRILCRINNYQVNGTQSSTQQMLAEATEAVDAGADEIILPMVESLQPVHQLLDALQGRAGVGIMAETEWSIANAIALSALPLTRVFIGLMDLMVQRRSRHIFENLRNGTVEQVRPLFRPLSFGFGGLTLPNSGNPLPCRLLMAEMVRLDTGFTFLRRSFFRDLRESGMGAREAAGLIRAELARMRERSPAEVTHDRSLLDAKLDEILSAAALVQS